MRESNQGYLNTAGLVALVFLASCGLFLIGMKLGEHSGKSGPSQDEATTAIATGIAQIGAVASAAEPAVAAPAQPGSGRSTAPVRARTPTPRPTRPRPRPRPGRRAPLREMTVEECGPIELPLPEDQKFVAEVNRLINQFLAGRGPRKVAREKLLALGKRAVPVLISRRNDPEMTVRWEVVNCGGYIEDPRQIPSICDNVMNDRNPHIRWRGMWALTEYCDRSPLISLLKNGLESPREFTRWNAAVALTMVGSRDSLDQIHEGLNWTDGWRRWEAVNALQRINSAESAELLIPIFKNGEDRHRQEAAMALGKIRTQRAAQVLIDHALKDRKAGVRWRACDALSRCRSTEAIPALEQLKKSDPDKNVRKHAGDAIRKIRGGR